MFSHLLRLITEFEIFRITKVAKIISNLIQNLKILKNPDHFDSYKTFENYSILFILSSFHFYRHYFLLACCSRVCNNVKDNKWLIKVKVSKILNLLRHSKTFKVIQIFAIETFNSNLLYSTIWYCSA